MAAQSRRLAYRKLLRSRCTMHVWVTACGHTWAIASGKPLSPSQITMSTSLVPRLRISISHR